MDIRPVQMTNIPQALLPNAAPAPANPGIADFSFDYAYPTTTQPSTSSSFWGGLANSTASVAEGTWDSVKGVWTATVNTVENAGGAIGDTAGNFVNSFYSKVEGVMTYFRDNIIILFAVLIGGVWILAKSGILKQAAAFV